MGSYAFTLSPFHHHLHHFITTFAISPLPSSFRHHLHIPPPLSPFHHLHHFATTFIFHHHLYNLTITMNDPTDFIPISTEAQLSISPNNIAHLQTQQSNELTTSICRNNERILYQGKAFSNWQQAFNTIEGWAKSQGFNIVYNRVQRNSDGTLCK